MEQPDSDRFLMVDVNKTSPKKFLKIIESLCEELDIENGAELDDEKEMIPKIINYALDVIQKFTLKLIYITQEKRRMQEYAMPHKEMCISLCKRLFICLKSLENYRLGLTDQPSSIFFKTKCQKKQRLELIEMLLNLWEARLNDLSNDKEKKIQNFSEKFILQENHFSSDRRKM